MLVLPGAALVSLVHMATGGGKQRPTGLLYSTGLSVAFWPLLLFYVTLVGLRITAPLIWVVLALSTVVLAFAWIRLSRGSARPAFDRQKLYVGASLGAIGILGFILRIADIQGLLVPMFGDSLHHTMIATIIADTGRVPSGYQPFVPVDTFTYHFGFHTLAAILSMLTSAQVTDSVLIVGQILIASAAVPTAYLLARELFASRYAGLFAALLTGFVSAMPDYYVNWGRYTQLAGQILLPVGLALLIRVARSVSSDSRGRAPWPWGDWVLAAFCVAGLVVVHYRILIFYGLFGLALGLWQLITLRGKWGPLRALWLREITLVLAGLALGAPWLANVFSNYFPGLVHRLQTVSTEYISSYNSLENFRHFTGLALVLAALVGLAVAIWRLARRTPFENPRGEEPQLEDAGYLRPAIASLVVATWVGLMIVAIWYPPGAIGSYTVAISMYIPLAALGGWGLAQLLNPDVVGRRVLAGVVPALVVVAAPFAALLFHTWQVADPGQFSYVHPADVRAFDWVRANTPQGSKFLISSEFSYSGRGVTASDAGMWLPLLAGRNVSVPALASWTEHPIDPQFFTETRTLAAYTQPAKDPEVQRLVATGTMPAPLSPSDPRFLSLMQQLGINYVYSGTTGGASKPRLDVAAMRKDGCHYNLVYPPQDGVYIFAIRNPPGGCK